MLRGEWLRAGRARLRGRRERPARRELDNVVLERAAFVCCDSRRAARKLESGDLIEPVERGVLDWLEVHELQEVVAGEVPGRQSDDDIVVFKSNGIAAWDVADRRASSLERARERGVGPRALALSASAVLGRDHVVADRRARPPGRSSSRDLLRRAAGCVT